MTTNSAFITILQSNVFRLDGPEIDLCESLQTLCESIEKDPLETDWSIGEGLECSLADLLIGAYWALTEWHVGQYSKEYETLCMIGAIYSPGYSNGPEESTGEQTAYDLIREYFEN